MSGETYFVPTDAHGTQFHDERSTEWPLPRRAAAGTAGTVEPGAAVGATGTAGTVEPGAAVEAPEGEHLVVHDLDGLLEHLGERIFVAEVLAGTGEHPTRARLVSETAWNLEMAARFALDCAEHVVVDPDEKAGMSASSLTEILEAARRYLDKGEEGDEADSSLVERTSRLALARRLRELGDRVSDVTLSLTVADEAADLDTFDDPAFAALASVRDAVLAVVEAIRHHAFPRLFETENVVYETDAEGTPAVLTTPWGSFVFGSPAGVVPAWTAASEAAERARQAIGDDGGPEAGAAERAWQRERLASLLATA